MIIGLSLWTCWYFIFWWSLIRTPLGPGRVIWLCSCVRYCPGTQLDTFWFSVTIFRRTLSRDVFERRTSTGSGLFALLSRDFEQIWGQIVSLRVKTLSNTNLVVPRHIKKKKAYFWLTSVAQKRRCLNTLLTSNVMTMNGTPIIVITGMRWLLFFICMKDTGTWFLNKNSGKYSDVHP